MPLPATGTEGGTITLDNGNTVGAGRVESVAGTRVLIVHGWDATEEWVEWARVRSVGK